MRFKKQIDLNACTLIEACYALTGSYREAGRLFTFILQWQALEDQLGHVPMQKDYIEFWGDSRATVERRMAQFRATFNKCETPSEIPRPKRTRAATVSLDGLVAA